MFNLEVPLPDDLEQAEACVFKYRDLKLSLTDSVNAVMAKRFKAGVCSKEPGPIERHGELPQGLAGGNRVEDDDVSVETIVVR